jgi:hypothetical protein
MEDREHRIQILQEIKDDVEIAIQNLKSCLEEEKNEKERKIIEDCIYDEELDLESIEEELATLEKII